MAAYKARALEAEKALNDARIAMRFWELEKHLAEAEVDQLRARLDAVLALCNGQTLQCGRAETHDFVDRVRAAATGDIT